MRSFQAAPGQPCGERDFELLWQDTRLSIRRGHLLHADGSKLPVLAMVPSDSEPERESIDRARHERALRSQLDADWALLPLPYSSDDERTRFLEAPTGQPLACLTHGTLPIARCLRVAVAITEAVARMHATGLVHKDIQPAHVFINDDCVRACLTGFGIASHLTPELLTRSVGQHPTGSPAYMSPEQTGRMNRAVDTRSDLYSLGVTLYELLTGTLPLQGAGFAEWVHSHLARLPPPPHLRRTDVPIPLSGVLMKLLAKAPEDRYQTAVGLRADLTRCLSEWEAHGRIDAFAPGGQDRSARLRFHDKLYGREAEMARLAAAHMQVSGTGDTRVVLVSGPSGVGKSSLVRELQKVLASTPALFASGKFDQYQRDEPYATLAQAFQGLVRELLGKPDDELAGWRVEMKAALGTQGGLMVGLIPDLEHLIGEQPPVPDLSGADARARFLQVFRRFVGVFARAPHPLVLFLDDLHWLDAATLEVFESLAIHPDIHHLLLIGAWRDHELEQAPLLHQRLLELSRSVRPPERIALLGLDERHTRRMLADALQTTPAAVSELADCVREKTGDNPFFMMQFIGSLVEQGLLRHDPAAGAWQWDLHGIRGQQITDNVVDLMIERLQRLPDAAVHTLQVMACVGNHSPRARLAIALDTSDADLRDSLRHLVHSGLVFEFVHEYAFSHDRIHEAAYSTLLAEDRRALHRLIGLRLLDQTPEWDLDNQVFEIVSHFNRADDRLMPEHLRVQVAQLNLRAGRKARAAAAYGAACDYLARGRSQLFGSIATEQHPLAFALALEQAECSFLRGDIAQARAMSDALLANAQDELEAAAGCRLQVELHMVNSEHAQAIDTSLTALTGLDIPIDPLPRHAEVLTVCERVWRSINARGVESLSDLPPMTDPAKLMALRLLAATWAPSSFGRGGLATLVVCHMVRLSLEHGVTRASHQGFALLGFLLGPVLGRYREGLQLAQFACDLAARGHPGPETNRTYNTMAMTSAWTQPLARSIEWSRLAYRKAIEVGDLYFASFSSFHTCVHSFMLGHDLENDASECRDHLRFSTETGYKDGEALITALERTIASLQGRTHRLGDFSDEEFDGPAFESAVAGPHLYVVFRFYWTMKTLLHFMAGEPEAALEAVERAQMGYDDRIPQVRDLDLQFFAALAVADALTRASADRRAALQARFDEHRAAVLEWSEHTQSPTFSDRLLLLDAELARLRGHVLEAEQLYETAARSARKHGFRHCEALAHELAANFYRTRGFQRIADIYLREALEAYTRWGAQGKVRQLILKYPGLKEMAASETPGYPMGHIDYLNVLKDSRSVSGELAIDQLLTTLMRAVVEQSGAQRGLLLRLNSARSFHVAAEAHTTRDGVVVNLQATTASSPSLPESFARWLSENAGPLIIDDATNDERFAGDPCVVHDGLRSVLCLPIASYGKPRVMLYLENRLAPRAFRATRLDVLKLLTTHAAVSLENARLYADLALRESKIRCLVESDVIGILVWSLSGELIDANDAFLRMVRYTRQDLENGSLRWREMTPPEWMGKMREGLRELKATGAMRPWEKEYVRKDGTRVPILIGAATFYGTPDRGVAFVLDLSERKAAEARARSSEHRHRELLDELAHANRVATMGQLSSWIAHDVKQPLAGIVNSANAGLRWLQNDKPNLDAARRALDRIVRDGMRAADILDQTRGLVKKVAPRVEPVEVRQVVAETLSLIASEAERKGIRIEAVPAGGPMWALADRVQLQQVVLNLLVNAIEAMRDGPTLGRTLSVRTDPDFEEGMLVVIRDTGCGLPPGQEEQCFEAFFTTKPDSLGMGLSICRSILELFGGRIWATRDETRGAEFCFVLPRPNNPTPAPCLEC